ncbi:hypothetical protein D0851_11320 [Marinobacter sp. Arc7-DN-1]|nr:hypothetical protein D0851_11320 [Marinobacter sp. Arc7-DN-1]
MTRWLFQSVRETLMCFLSDPAYLGAQPGILSVLHTWGRSLTLHPHIHCAITEGGLDDQGLWRLPVRNCFLPIRAVMFKYRGHFLAQLKSAVDCGELSLPDGETPTSSHNLFNRLGRKPWNVNLRERYDNAEGVVEYLARYVRGGRCARVSCQGSGPTRTMSCSATMRTGTTRMADVNGAGRNA